MVPVQHLPKADSPDLHLVLATPAEILQQLHHNSEEWRGALTLDAYLRREEVLGSQELTKNGGLTSWMLVQGEGEGRRVLCGCESIRKKALVAGPGARDGVEEVACHGVASVFCPHEYRGRGYAGRMMQELGPRLKEWDARGKRVLMSVLFSDIGKTFYTRRGWHPFPSSHITLSPAPASHSLPVSKPLGIADLAPLCIEDEKLLQNRLSKSSASSKDKTNIAILPNIETLKWHHAREEFVMNELKSEYPNQTPGIKGAIIGSTPGDRVWCYWTRVWANPNESNGNTLHILRLVIDQEGFDDFDPAVPDAVAKYSKNGDDTLTRKVASLFQAAQEQAKEWDMRSVQLWNPSSLALAAARLLEPMAEVTERQEDSIASLMWYGEGDEKGVEWVCNEKYGWC